MTRRALVPLAAGVEEIEAVTLIDVLRRAGVEVVVAGLEPGVVEASRGVRLLPDTTLDEVEAGTFDLVVLPGGAGGAQRLAADPRIAALLTAHRARGRTVAAICAAPLVLEQAGLLAGRRATGHPSVLALLESAERTEERVVRDGGIVTSRGAGSAMELALALVEELEGSAKVEELRAQLVAR